MPTWTLRLPSFHPTLVNTVRGKHWSAEHRAKKRDAQVYGTYALVQGIPRATGRRRVSILVSGWERGGRIPDADAPVKVTMDALVRAGLLLDDGPGGLEGQAEVLYVRGPQCTTITLEDVDDASTGDGS